MERDGQHIPSHTNFLSIHVNKDKNDMEKMKLLQNLQVFHFDTHKILTEKFFIHGRSPFIYLHTNLTNRPLKMLIDTGAAISLIVKNSIEDDSNKRDFKLKLLGIGGQEKGTETAGIIDTTITINGCRLHTTFHILEQNAFNIGDGILGFDILYQFRAKIDIEKKCIQFKLDEIIQTEGKFELNDANKNMNEETNEQIDSKKQRIYQNMDDLNKQMDIHAQLRKDKENTNNLNKTVGNLNENIVSKSTHDFDGNLNMLIENYDINNQNKNENDEIKTSHDEIESPIDENYNTSIFFYEREFERKNEFKAKKLENENIQKIYDVTNEKHANLSRNEMIFEQLKLNSCSDGEKQFIQKVCFSFPFQFYLDGDILGHTDVIQHSIKLLSNAKTVNVRQYRIPHIHKKILEDIIID